MQKSIYNSRSTAAIAVVFGCLTTTGVLAGPQVTVPLPYDYSFDMDPSSSTCTNTKSNTVLTGPLSVNFGEPNVRVLFKQNARKYKDTLNAATVAVGPTNGTISANKKLGTGMGNPYISYKDDQTQAFGQLGRCVAASSQSVWNRLRDDGSQTALLTAGLSQLSCSNRSKTINLDTTHSNAGATGLVYLTNQLLLDPTNATAAGAGTLSVTLTGPGSIRKGGPVDSGAAGGNPYVSMQIADCKLGRSNPNTTTCEADVSAQILDAANQPNPDSRFPYNADGTPNSLFADKNGRQWGQTVNGVTYDKVKKFSLHGPLLTAETDPVRCNQM